MPYYFIKFVYGEQIYTTRVCACVWEKENERYKELTDTERDKERKIERKEREQEREKRERRERKRKKGREREREREREGERKKERKRERTVKESAYDHEALECLLIRTKYDVLEAINL